jgi:hypothetical protein
MQIARVKRQAAKMSYVPRVRGEAVHPAVAFAPSERVEDISCGA